MYGAKGDAENKRVTLAFNIILPFSICSLLPASPIPSISSPFTCVYIA